jgi:hypothetical protein
VGSCIARQGALFARVQGKGRREKVRAGISGRLAGRNSIATTPIVPCKTASLDQLGKRAPQPQRAPVGDRAVENNQHRDYSEQQQRIYNRAVRKWFLLMCIFLNEACGLGFDAELVDKLGPN